MSKSLLIVAVEAGAFAYIRPFLGHLSSTATPGSWRIVLGPAAAKTLSERERADLPLVPFDADRPEALSSSLDGESFDVLVTSASASPIERTAIQTAKRCGARVLSYIDAFTGYSERFNGDGEVMKPDGILVIDDGMKAEAEADGLPADRLIVVGQPAWENINPMPAAPTATVLFAAQPVRRYYADSLPYDEHSAWRFLVECRRLRPDLIEDLIYAVHPAMTPPSAGALCEFETTSDRHSALERCGTVTGMFSSMLTEALLAGRRVISLQPGLPGNDLCVLSRLGRIERVGDIDEFIAAMQHPPRDNGDLRTALEGSLDRFVQHVMGRP